MHPSSANPRDPVLAGTAPAYQADVVPALLKHAPRVWMLFGYDAWPPYAIAPGSTDALGVQEGAWSDDGATLYLYRSPASDGAGLALASRAKSCLFRREVIT